MPRVFEYSSEDVASGKNSFDRVWEEEWERVAGQGLLRYAQPRVNAKTKLVSEPFKFAFQFLLDRGTKRRNRVQFDSVNEPFSATRFHFGKIDENEILFELKNVWRRRGENQNENAARTLAIVNVSPIEWGHFLLVPQVEENLPQRLNPRAVSLALEVLNLSNKQHFRMMYNSLLGWASVNHLHFHCYEFPHELVLDNLPSEPFHRSVRLTSRHFPLPGFVLNVTVENIAQMTETIAKIIDILHELDCAHNVVLCKGSDPSVPGAAHLSRFYIFPRALANTAIVSQCVDPACVELSGQFPCKAEAEWESLTGQAAAELIATVNIDVALQRKIRERIRAEI